MTRKAARTIHTPGTTPGPDAADGAADDAATDNAAPAAAEKGAKKPARLNNAAPADADAARVAALELQVTQLAALVKHLVEHGRASVDEAAPAKPVKLIGDDVRPMTSHQVLAAVAAGQMERPTRAVMCADGYLAPV